jgi:hypothetical protein
MPDFFRNYDGFHPHEGLAAREKMNFTEHLDKLE